MITQVRTARPVIMLNGVDYYNELAPYLLRFAYTDNCDGEKADDLQFDLADRDRKFINEWMPIAGANLVAGIKCERWFSPAAPTLVLDCGQFWIDDLEFDLPAHIVRVKANSIPSDCYIKNSNESRPFEKQSLKDIVSTIAAENGLEPSYLAQKNPQYDAVEQITESGLHFLHGRTDDVSLSIKVAKGQLIVFDEHEKESDAPSFTLVYGDAQSLADSQTYRMSGAKFHLMVVDTTATSKASKTDMATGDGSTGQFTAGDISSTIPGSPAWIDHIIWDPDTKDQPLPGLGGGGGSGRATPVPAGLVDYTDNDSAMTDKAKAHTRDKNKHKNDAIIELSMGNPLIAAGMTFNIVGCGQFDGKWFIYTAHHEIAGMYNTVIGARRCLQGY